VTVPVSDNGNGTLAVRLPAGTYLLIIERA
jgi:hypothetical protein